MTAVLLAGALPFLLGLPVAVALSGRWLLGAVAAPLVGALVLTSAGVAGVVTRSDPTRWLLVMATVALIAPVPTLGRMLSARSRPSWRGREVVPVFLGALIVSLPFLQVARSPTDWDAHSIWMFHGEWFATGGDAGRDAFTNAAFEFSHPDYPPLVPSTGGLASRVATGDHEWRAAQLAQVTAGLSAALLLFLGTLEVIGRRAVAVGAAVLAGLAIAAESSVGIANAEADHLGTASFAAAAVLLLGARSVVLFRLGLVVATVAVLTKGEILFATIALLGAVVFLRRDLDGRRLLAVPAVVGVGWLLVVFRVLGAESRSTAGGRLSPGRFVRAESFSRGWRAVGEMVREIGPLVGLAAVAVAATWLVGRGRSEQAVLAVRLVLVAAAPFVVVLTSYAVGGEPIVLWLAASVSRTTLATNALLVTATAVAAAAVLRPVNERLVSYRRPAS